MCSCVDFVTIALELLCFEERTAYNSYAYILILQAVVIRWYILPAWKEAHSDWDNMDLISGHSPSSSVSPPISPIKVFSQPGATLPPLKSLPLWNRTSLEKSRFIRSITKDSPENTKTEIFLSHLTSKGTQTSPPSTAIGNISQQNGEHRQDIYNRVGNGNASTIPDKKLYFLQAEHEGVLKKLHIELENLKSKNRGD